MGLPCERSSCGMRGWFVILIVYDVCVVSSIMLEFSTDSYHRPPQRSTVE